MYVPTPLDEYVITPMPDGTWSVWNEPKDTRYAVWQAGNGRFRCTCEDWTYRCKKWGVDCKHITLVKASTKREETHDNHSRSTHFSYTSLGTTQTHHLQERTS